MKVAIPWGIKFFFGFLVLPEPLEADLLCDSELVAFVSDK